MDISYAWQLPPRWRMKQTIYSKSEIKALISIDRRMQQCVREYESYALYYIQLIDKNVFYAVLSNIFYRNVIHFLYDLSLRKWSIFLPTWISNNHWYNPRFAKIRQRLNVATQFFDSGSNTVLGRFLKHSGKLFLLVLQLNLQSVTSWVNYSGVGVICSFEI